MQSPRKTWFISDLHLDPSSPDIANDFIKLIQHWDSTIDNIYILGDLFELWIGDDDKTPFNDLIIQTLKNATAKGAHIHVIRGNRDFLLGNRFEQETGVKLIADETLIQVYGTSVLIMHGDTLCTRDTAYLRARRFTNNRLLQKLFLMLPIQLRQKIAASAREASKKHTMNTQAEIMDVTQEEVERVMQKHGVKHLIHGHTHKPHIHQFYDHFRIVLPAWHQGGSVFIWDEQGNKELIEIKKLK